MSNDHAHLTWCELGYHHWNGNHCTSCDTCAEDRRKGRAS